MTFTAPGFEAVAEAFHRNFTELGEIGGAFAAYRDGELVVDLWGGAADPATGRSWHADTLPLIFSGTKGLVTACVLLLVERGLLALDAPVARYWPEFAAEGKQAITVADVLTHRSRLPGLRAPFTTRDLMDQKTMAGLLAAQAPETDPRAEFMYHALTFGWLVGEVVQRTDGRDIGGFFADEFARSLGLDVWIGLPDEHHARAAVMSAAPGVLTGPLPDTDDPLLVSVHNPLTVADAPTLWNSAVFRRAGLPAVGAFATARSMARFYACLAAGGELDGVRVLAPSTVELGRRERRRGVDPMWGAPMAYGVGFELNTELETFGPAPDAFGHAGFGGSRHGAWPSDAVAFSYAMNETRTAPDQRPMALLAALRQATR